MCGGSSEEDIVISDLKNALICTGSDEEFDQEEEIEDETFDVLCKFEEPNEGKARIILRNFAWVIALFGFFPVFLTVSFFIGTFKRIGIRLKIFEAILQNYKLRILALGKIFQRKPSLNIFNLRKLYDVD